jgi:hypothetical protein
MRWSLVALAAAALGACGEQGSSGAGGAPYAGFRASVIPVFDGCAESMCHGAGAPSGLVLGPSSDVSAGEVRQHLLSGMPKAAPTLTYVVPGDPAQSFLYDKLTGTLDGLACPSGCGVQMPAVPVDVETVRIWIARGAADD